MSSRLLNQGLPGSLGLRFLVEGLMCATWDVGFGLRNSNKHPHEHQGFAIPIINLHGFKHAAKLGHPRVFELVV